MPLLILSFVFAWCLRHWWDGRKNDYSARDNDYRARVRGASQRHAGQRYAAGWGLFQLRHGWGPMARDVRDGWNDAQTARKAWDDGAGERPASAAAAWRAGWGGGARPATPIPAAPHDPATPAPSPEPEPEQAPRAPVIPINANGGTMPAPTMTGEVNSLDAYRRHLEAARARAGVRLETAGNDLAAAEQAVTMHDTAHASLTAVGLGSQTIGGMAALMESEQAEKTAAQQAVQRAESDMATIDGLISALHTQGHTSMQEAVTNATAPVAKDTDWYAAQ